MECTGNSCKTTSSCTTSGCETKQNHCCKGNQWGCDMTAGMMKLADDAWAELMKEKMKQHFEKVSGEKMNKMAESLVNVSMEYWQAKMNFHAKKHAASDAVKDAFRN